jgi:hypothetical protein
MQQDFNTPTELSSSTLCLVVPNELVRDYGELQRGVEVYSAVMEYGTAANY